MTRIRNERGSALIVAMVVMGLLLSASLGTLEFIDRSQSRSGHERIRETSFNVTEAVLNEEVLRLNRKWPSLAKDASPATCTASTTGCPEPSQVINGFAGVDTAAGVTWQTQVRDNLGAVATYYSKAVADATACFGKVPCTWDSNKDGALWIRASANVRGRTRTLVALVKQQVTRISLPRTTLTAGWFKTTNNGLKTMVDEKGCLAKHKPAGNCNATDPAPVVVRCSTTTPGTSNDPCLGYRSGQVSPAVTQLGQQGNVLPNTTVDQMRAYAVELGTYFDSGTGCPSTVQASGQMVFIEGINCSYTGGIFNTPATPGFIVINKGTIAFGGTVEYYGVVFAANNFTPPADAGALVNITGSATVQGAVFVEGNGGVSIGGAGLGVSFDPNALGGFSVSGNPSIVHNSYRELLAGQ
jgi:Tfp pilus assembly protein PilX